MATVQKMMGHADPSTTVRYDRYDLWGDTVNVASRMEFHGSIGKVQITASTYELIKDDFVCEPKESISVKGMGKMPVWHVIAEKDSFVGKVHLTLPP